MPSFKDLKLAQQNAAQQQQAIADLQALARDVDRCERTIVELQRDLASVNSRYPGQRTTREDIAYLTDLLKCANRKLAWEKHIASLQKRTPALLERLSRLLNDTKAPPDEPVRAEMLRALQEVQAAMERLQNSKTG